MYNDDRKITKTHLLNLVRFGWAKEINYQNASYYRKRLRYYYKIGYCYGMYGITGMLIRSQSGKLFAVVDRSAVHYFY